MTITTSKSDLSMITNVQSEVGYCQILESTARMAPPYWPHITIKPWTLMGLAQDAAGPLGNLPIFHPGYLYERSPELLGDGYTLQRCTINKQHRCYTYSFQMFSSAAASMYQNTFKGWVGLKSLLLFMFYLCSQMRMSNIWGANYLTRFWEELVCCLVFIGRHPHHHSTVAVAGSCPNPGQGLSSTNRRLGTLVYHL